MEFTKISTCFLGSLLVGLLSFCGLFSCVHTRQALGGQKFQVDMHNSQPAATTSTDKSATESSSGSLINHGFLPEDSQSEASKLANFESQHPECLSQTNKENLILHNVISTGMLAGACGILARISTGIYLWTKGSYSFPESTFMNATTPIDH